MMVSNEVRAEFSGLLRELSEELDLPPSKREDAEEKYRAVAEWLGKEDSELAPFEPDIYPHGSFRLGTVVRPLGRDEYDLDFVCKLVMDPETTDQRTVKGKVGRRLHENGIYRGNRMIEEKNRCWRLNHAGDFHMDIMPAVDDPRFVNGAIFVPDRKLQRWMPSNPKGFATWFDSRQVQYRSGYRMAYNASVEELPDCRIKTPLQVAIQILKRHRDVRFRNDPDDRPSSIIITTLAAQAYDQQADVADALLDLARAMPDHVEFDPHGLPLIRNPTNPEENFAEKWREHPGRYRKFKAWLRMLREDIDRLLQTRGLNKIGELLGETFGDREANAVLRHRGEEMNRQHRLGRVGTSAGAGLTVGAGRPTAKNRFWGGGS